MGGYNSGARVKYVYAMIDLTDKYELPLFVGTLAEFEEELGIRGNTILSAISNAKKRGQRCRYIKVYELSDEDE